MKYKVVAVALLALASSAHAADPQRAAAAGKACTALSMNVKAIAERRDQGTPKATMVQLLESQPFTPTIGLLLAATNDVYKDTHMTPVQLEQRYKQQCIQQFAGK